MGILTSILDKIFPSSDPKNSADPVYEHTIFSTDEFSISPDLSMPQPTIARIHNVDVEKVLNDLSKSSNETSHWDTSIIDLLKLIGFDSSPQSLNQLARELNYPGDMNDSNSMNLWLHKQVMSRIGVNFGSE